MDSENSMITDWLELKDIDIYYGQKQIIKNISFSLKLGQNTVIIGENGSGKSTLLKIITKLKYAKVKKNSYIKHFGYVRINIWDFRKKVGIVLSEIDSRIKNNMSTSDVILSGYKGTFGVFNSKEISLDQKESFVKTSELLGIKNISKYYSELSDGQKRRVLIARSIINKPDVLILDEPTSMLDLKGKYELLKILSKLAKQGITLLYVTNSIDNVIKETNRVLCIKDGKLILDGEPKAILNSKNVSNLYDYRLNVSNELGYWMTSPK